jgi:hypothetical protein
MEVWRTSRRPQREPARTGMSRVAGVVGGAEVVDDAGVVAGRDRRGGPGDVQVAWGLFSRWERRRPGGPGVGGGG